MKKSITIIICLFLLYTSCKDKLADTRAIQKQYIEKGYDLPLEIVKYMQNNNEWVLIDASELGGFKTFSDSLNTKSLISVQGDFNYNGTTDLALMVNKNMENLVEIDSALTHLLIFNDYKESLNAPDIVYFRKSVEVSNNSISYYLSKSRACNKDVVRIMYPDVYEYFVYWNGMLNHYNDMSPTELKSLCETIEESQKGYTPRKPKAILGTYKIDLNLDGKPDKINVHSNNNHEDFYDAKHFGLPIELIIQTENGFEETKQNDSLIFENPHGAMIEGFEYIDIKDKYFTIVQQTHSDFNILVSCKTTFKLSTDEILLHKYQEEYFDKADHDREIPSRVWTKNDFGDIEFESLRADFLRKLSQGG